jgi:hypothetical protein
MRSTNVLWWLQFLGQGKMLPHSDSGRGLCVDPHVYTRRRVWEGSQVVTLVGYIAHETHSRQNGCSDVVGRAGYNFNVESIGTGHCIDLNVSTQEENYRRICQA